MGPRLSRHSICAAVKATSLLPKNDDAGLFGGFAHRRVESQVAQSLASQRLCGFSSNGCPFVGRQQDSRVATTLYCMSLPPAHIWQQPYRTPPSAIASQLLFKCVPVVRTQQDSIHAQNRVRARWRPGRMRKNAPDHVILSEAKDLLLFVFTKIQQMLRCAQHDRFPFSGTCYGSRVFPGRYACCPHL
jgi:hypothetical protein